MNAATAVEYLERALDGDHVPPEALAQLASSVEAWDVEAGDVLVHEGSRTAQALLIVDGTAAVKRGPVRVGTIGAGSFAGECAFLPDLRSPVTVVAETDIRMLVVGPRGIELLMAIPAVAARLLRSLAVRLDQVAGAAAGTHGDCNRAATAPRHDDDHYPAGACGEGGR